MINNTKSYTIPVENEYIKNEDLSPVEEVLEESLQNNAWLQDLIFTLNFKFLKQHEPDEELRADEWVTNRVYEKWFEKLGKQFPYIMFFLKEWHHRMYTVSGDLLRKGRVQVDIEDKMLHFVLEDEEIGIVDRRVMEACRSFMELCEEKGVDCEDHVRYIMDEFKVKFDYEDL